jgi:hypothetical protein
MIRTAATLLFLFVAITLAASTVAARPRFGVVALPQITQLASRSYEFGTADVKWSWAGGGGVVAELPLPGRFSLATGLEYSEHADDQSTSSSLTVGITPVTLAVRRELRLRIAALPVRVEWRSGRWRLGAGPEVRYLVRADQRVSVSSSDIATTPGTVAEARGRGAQPAAQIFESSGQSWSNETDQFRRWSLAAQFAVGREFPLGGHLLRADLRWSEGITDQQWYSQITQRTRAAQLALGFLW